MFASRYVNIDLPYERGWKPQYIVLVVSVLICIFSIFTFSSRYDRPTTILFGDLDPMAYNPKDFQDDSSKDLKYALPHQVDDIYNTVDDEVGAMEKQVAVLKKKLKGPEIIDISITKIGPPGPKGPPGIQGSKGLPGPERSGPQPVKACEAGYFFNGASCYPCTTGGCPVGMYRTQCSSAGDSRCISCTSAPSNSFYSADGTHEKCEWVCDPDYFRSSGKCLPCSSGPCPVGKYRALCSNEADSQCAPCTNLLAKSVFTSPGLPGDPKSCKLACADGHWDDGKACNRCETSPCAAGQYRTRCTATSNSRCAPCTVKPANARFTTAGSPFDANTCEWECDAGYYRDGQTCAACSAGSCAVGQYRTLCAAKSDSRCAACTNLPPNALFTSAGQPGDPASCRTSCAPGFWRNGAACAACDTSSCGVGQYRGACSAAANAACAPCSTRPPRSSYTSAGRPFGADACDWTCDAGYFRSGPTCSPCSRPACPIGQYGTLCTAAADSACKACTNLPTNGAFTSNGQQPGDAQSCQTGCVPGYFKVGQQCIACDTTSCGLGQYRSACSAAADGRCVACTKAPPNARYTSGGKPYGADACDWTCNAGYFRDGAACTACSTSACPVGQYRTACAASANSACQPCTNLPANGIYTSAGQQGDAASCQTGCVAGYFKVGQQCIACDTTSCQAGRYRSACTAAANGQCVSCTKAPANAAYTSAGKPYGADACDWSCNPGYYQNGDTCALCSTAACQVGQYRTLCGARANSACQPCTNLPANGVFSSNGQQNSPGSCQTACVPGYFKQGAACAACDTSSCAVGQYRSACTATANGQCTPCTKGPPRSLYTSAGKPYGADACEWSCQSGYFVDGARCTACSTSACPIGQYRTLCTAAADSACKPCTNLPTNGVFTSNGQQGAAMSCQTGCVSGYFKVGQQCIACDTTSCEAGKYRSACSASANGQCVACTKAPPNARYTSAGKPYGADACDWSCNPGYYQNGAVCSLCSTSACPVGQYRTLCGARANSACQPCTNLPANAVHTTTGQQGDAASCQFKCVSGYFRVGSACVACDTTSCGVGKYRSACSAAADGQCVSCTTAPLNAVYTSGGKPYGADACDWSCKAGYFLNGATCAPCSTSTCRVGQYRTTCGTSTDSACRACTNAPANGIYTTTGVEGDPNSCQTSCAAGYWRQGAACVACDTSSCPSGQYRSACTSTANGQCTPCTRRPQYASYTSAGKPFNADACDWRCDSGYYLAGSVCALCSTLTCPAGQYSTTCTPTVNSVCAPCTNLPANSVYTTAGQKGNANSCQTACAPNYWRQGSSCVACDTSSCAVGQYRGACTASANGQCTSCTKAPSNARYTSAGKPYNADACDWSCKEGFYRSGSSCVACSTLTCPTGQYSTTCTPTANSACSPCTNLPANGVYSSAGQLGNPNSCQTGCSSGYWKQGSGCVACDTSSCAVGRYRGACTASANGQCTSCTKAPSNARYTSAGKPYNADACDWSCQEGFYVSGSVCSACSTPDCPVGQYRTTCTPTANSICAACTNLPANSVYSSAGQPGNANSCKTGCASGYYANGGACAGCKDLVFTLRSGGDNYADCNGAYALDSRKINGRPLYINAAKSRFLAWNTGSWVITGTQWLDGILASQGYFGAFQANDGNADPMLGWGNYDITYPQSSNAYSTCPSFWTCPSGYYVNSAACVACQNLLFTTKPGADNYADCSGMYVKDSRKLNGKPIYINAAKSRFLGFSSGGAWVLTATGYLDGILKSGGRFGGFHKNDNGEAMLGWGSYDVTYPKAPAAQAACPSSWTCPSGHYLDSSACSSCQNLLFTTKPGADNYADCSGMYVIDQRSLNGKPLYINAAKSRFLGYSSNGAWVLTGTQWLDGILKSGGSFGGFHGNGNGDAKTGWASYNVQKPPGC